MDEEVIRIPCARCGKSFPPDPLHKDYPDVHHCEERPLEEGAYDAVVVSVTKTSITLEIDGGPHDGTLIVCKL